MSEQNNETQWYIARDGKQHGPLTDIEMRTFVAHNYLRQTDLIWRPGMAEWLPAPTVFPAVFATETSEATVSEPQPQPEPEPSYPHPMAAPTYAGASSSSGHDLDVMAEPPAQRGVFKRAAMAAVAITIIGGGAFAVAMFREPITQYLSAETAPATVDISAPVVAEAPVSAEPPVVAAPETAPVDAAAPEVSVTVPAEIAATPTSESQTATLAPPAAVPEPPAQSLAVTPSIDGSQIDAKLQKIPAWALIKKDYPDWYVGHIAAAEKLSAEQKPDNEISLHLAQGLVALRRQNAEKALAASPDKLRRIATAFLDNLKALRSQSVTACYGFISKGETSPAVVQLVAAPDAGAPLHKQIAAVFEAISEGSKSPIKHDAAVKTDYDLLIKELGKLGWKEEDLQVFSNPALLAKREPDRVCKMVQEWFVAHLAVQDTGARDRLLYETLKPVVSG